MLNFGNCRKILVIVVIAMSLAAMQADARSRGDATLTPSACGKPSPAGQDDGCQTALANGGLYRFPNYFNDARQSGQASYRATPSWNVACVDAGYGCGPDTDDAHLTDFKTSVPSGWSVLVPNQIYQNGSPATLNRYFLNDIGIFKAAGNLILTNSHIRMGRNTCRSFTGTAPVNVQSPTAAIDIHNNLFDTSDECSWQAELYGTSYDPGLIQQSSENISIAANTLTINSGGAGFFAEGQFLKWNGIAQQVRVGANISPGGLKNCTGSACNGTIWTVCEYISVRNSGACNASVRSVGPVDATTGPIQPTANAAIRQAAIRGTPSCKVQYNVFWMFSTPGVCSTGGDTNVQFNFAHMCGHSADHDNFWLNAGEPGVNTTISYRQKFNTAWWDRNCPSTGTTLFGNFLTSNNNNKVGGVQISWNPFDVSYNTGITNKTDYPNSNSAVTAAMWRALQQGTATTVICNSGPTCSGSSISGNVLTVADVVSGASLAVGDAITCNACNWAGAVKITSIGVASDGARTYNLSRNVGSVTPTASMSAFRYNGILVNQIGENNYFDATGAGTNFIFDSKNDVGTCRMGGNVNMLTGATIPSPCP